MAGSILDQLSAAQSKVGSSYEDMSRIDRQRAAGYVETANDVASNTAAKGELELQRQNKIQGMASGWGVQSDSSGDILYKLGQQWQKEQAVRDEAFAAYEEKRSTSFLQNPIQYLVNQYTVQDDIERFNNATVKGDMMAQRMAQVNAAVQEGAKTAAAVSTKVTAATIAGDARIAASESTQRSLEATRQSIADSALGVEKVMQLGVERQNMLFRMEERKRAQEQMEWARTQHAMQLEEFAHKKENWEANAALANYEFEKVARGHLMRTGQELDKQISLAIRAGLKEGKAPAGEFGQDYVLGSNVPGAPGSIAHSAMDFLRLQKTYGYTYRPGQEAIQPILKEAEGKLGDILRSGFVNEPDPNDPKKMVRVPITQKDTEKVSSLYNKLVDELVKRDFSDASVTSASKPNLSRVPSLQEIVKTTPGLMKQKVNGEILGPLLQSGVNPDPNTVWDTYMAAVADGKVSLPEAVGDYSLLYQRGVLLNQATQGLSTFGIIPPEAGRMYRYSFPDGEVVDRTKPEELMRKAARDIGRRTRSYEYQYDRGPVMGLVDLARKGTQGSVDDSLNDRSQSGVVGTPSVRKQYPEQEQSPQQGQGFLGGPAFQRDPRLSGGRVQ